MPTTTTRVATEHGRKYMIQLAKHWSHRMPDLIYDDTRADVPLPSGPLVIEAGDDGLILTLTADDAVMDRMKGVVEEHLNRFAFRETLAYDWTTQG